MPATSQAIDQGQTEMPHDGAPLSLQAKLQEAEAQLSSAAHMPDELQFKWCDVAFGAVFEEVAYGQFALHLSGNLGRLAYSAENADARREALDLVRSFNADSTADKFRIGRTGEILLESETRCQPPENKIELTQLLSAVLLSLNTRLAKLCPLLQPAT